METVVDKSAFTQGLINRSYLEVSLGRSQFQYMSPLVNAVAGAKHPTKAIFFRSLRFRERRVGKKYFRRFIVR